MARKLRLEFPGACYHVINRGNYRTDIFRTEGAKLAFERCLFEACATCGWLLYAFIIMRNHFHLAIETPLGNLAAGMHWLEGTFANRFNRFRDERGHLFQGRYKALVVERGDPLAMVGNYIHLNPVRAGILSVQRLVDYRYSSYWYLARPEARAPVLKLDHLLALNAGLTDTSAGWSAYHDHLSWQAEAGPTGRSKAYVSLSKGWVLGSAGFKADLIRDHALAASARAWEDRGAKEIRELRWEELCSRALELLHRTRADLGQRPKSASWRVAVAAILTERAHASNPWLAHRLSLGSAKYASYLVIAAQRAPTPAPELQLLRRKLRVQR